MPNVLDRVLAARPRVVALRRRDVFFAPKKPSSAPPRARRDV